MGNRASSRSKDERESMDAMSSAFFKKEIERLENYRGPVTSTAIVPSSTAVTYLETMKKQLERKDKVGTRTMSSLRSFHSLPELDFEGPHQGGHRRHTDSPET
jgi:hypothetical protein